VRFLVEGQETSGSVAVFEFDLPASSRIAEAHSHDGYEETLYGVEGVLTWTVDATQLAIVAPGILGPHYFREVGAILEAAVGGPPDVAALGAVMRRRGLTPAP